ncbi:threonine dehydratase [Roseimicrobium gellanilyticum]|uniref:Threonine dehydratase n=1 Tax=Roseimicrobium gellanilyticum TaxID=748857 RepID=A0A366HVA9_9BACT|nr:threonine dehydratase [Roseimicrobium gellanilyticum]RBP47800.1 threonine dehydratase [Roseimicrobium gellanilyticum]
MTDLPVTYADVLDALPRVHGVLGPTLLRNWPGLSALLGCEFHLKHENHQPVGAFKVRGGINLVGTLSAEERAAGILGVSTGNHGQSLAFAAQHFGVKCTIVVPRGNNPDKNRAIQQLGAEMIEHGKDFDEAREFAATLQKERGFRYVHSANEPKLIAGVGTIAWEIFEKLPDPDVLLVPIGLGSGVCGACLVAKHRNPRTKVIGVQAVNASAVAESWRTGTLKTNDSVNTWAEGLATRVPAEMTLQIMRELMDDVILVSEEELRIAAARILEHTHNLAEGAGAATVAAAMQQRERFADQRVVAVLSGGNLDLVRLPEILQYVGK